jgi:glycosyltransferase involved in cell wall biosynthesis
MTSSKIRILWLSDTPHRPSGFGIVSREVCGRLSALGYDITMLGWWTKSSFTSFSGIPVWRCPERPSEAVRVLAEHVHRCDPHFLIALGDIPWLSYLAEAPFLRSIARSEVRLCLYFPIDGVQPDGRIPPRWIDILRTIDIPITMSQFGLSAVTCSGVTASYIPHGCDVDVFKPPSSKRAAKHKFGYDGKFVVLSDMRNHRRKLFPRLLDIGRALALPENKIVFHIHTNMRPEEDRDEYEYDIQADVSLLGLAPIIRFTTTSSRHILSTRKLAALYAAADVHLSTSHGEGFGLPTLQAASSGVVPIACLHSANTELVGHHGFAVPPDSTTMDEFGLVRGFIDCKIAANTLRGLFEDRTQLREKSRLARRFAMDYSWDSVVARWDHLLRASMSRQPRRSASVHPAVSYGSSLDEGQAPIVRPSGHSSLTLPEPRLTIPVGLRNQRPILIILPDSVYNCLSGLKHLFPGIKLMVHNSVETDRLLSTVRAAALIVDPDRSLHPRIDVACAVVGTSFIGNSSYWPRVRLRGWFLQARAVLTNMPLAERRASISRRLIDRDFVSSSSPFECHVPAQKISGGLAGDGHDPEL